MQNLFYVIQGLKINKIHRIYFCDFNLEGKTCGTSFCNGFLKSRAKMTNLIFCLTPVLILIFLFSKKKETKKFQLVAKIRNMYLWFCFLKTWKRSSCSIYVCESLQHLFLSLVHIGNFLPNLATWVNKMELIPSKDRQNCCKH